MPADFQTDTSARLSRLEQDVAAIRAMLSERCQVRGADLNDHEIRITALEVREHRRSGGMAVIAAMWAVAGTLGGMAAKFLPFGGGQ